MNSEEYRILHESLINNNTGTTTTEVFLATLTIPMCSLLNSLLLPSLLPQCYWHLHYSSRVSIQMFVELFTIAIPVLLGFTLYSNNIATILAVLTTSIVTMLLQYGSLIKDRATLEELLRVPCWIKKPPFLTNYRAGMIFATAFCILAVDFPIFPRRFAKTEMYGYGLMDVGVASFVLAAGLVLKNHETRLRNNIIIFLLGLLRLVMVKALNYREHVTEYGVHWNFFFTLAITNVAGPLLSRLAKPILLAVASLGIYQVLLFQGLETWILSSAPRDTVFAANREGLFSLFGYMALYWIASEIGSFMRQSPTDMKSQLKVFAGLSAISLAGSVALPFVEAVFGITSRRLANVPYCLWMVSFNIGILAACLGVDLVLIAAQFFRDKSRPAETTNINVIFREPYLFRVINFNGLLFFLLANVLTGLINVTLQTMTVSAVQSFLVLIGYCVGICVPVVCSYVWRVRI